MTTIARNHHASSAYGARRAVRSAHGEGAHRLPKGSGRPSAVVKRLRTRAVPPSFDLPAPNSTLGSKVQTFVALTRSNREYQQVIVPSWLYSVGNGALAGCMVGLFARAGSLSSAQSFLAYAAGESTDMLLWCILDVVGTHRRDEAQPSSAGESVAIQRQRHCVELRRQCYADLFVGAVLLGVTASLGTGSLWLLPALLGVNMVMTCKNSYSRNLFTCMRQLGRDESMVTRARSVGQTLVSMEALVGTASYHIASLSVQCLFLRSAASAFVPLTVGAIVAGVAVSALPKLYVARYP